MVAAAHKPGHRRRGFLLTIELLLILPLLLLVLSAIVQLCLLATTRSHVTSAAAAVAHTIAAAPQDADQIRDQLRTLLGPRLASGAVADVIIPDEPGQTGHLRVQVRIDRIVPQLPGRNLITGDSQWLVVRVPIMMIRAQPASLRQQRL